MESANSEHETDKPKKMKYWFATNK